MIAAALTLALAAAAIYVVTVDHRREQACKARAAADLTYLPDYLPDYLAAVHEDAANAAEWARLARVVDEAAFARAAEAIRALPETEENAR